MLQVKPKYRPTIDELLSHDIIKSRMNELNLEDPVSENSVEQFALEDLNNNYTHDLPLPNYGPSCIDRDILCSSEQVIKEPLNQKNVTIDDYDMAIINNSKPLFLHKSIEESTNANSINMLSGKKSIPGSIASRKLLSSLKKHIKKTNRYKSSARVDNSMPYHFKDTYKDLLLLQKSSKDSLRSISQRKSIINNKFRLKYKSK